MNTVLEKNEGYLDITKDYKCLSYYEVRDTKYFKDSNGNKYYVDDRNVILDYSKKEKEVAIWLSNTFGGKIYMLPKVNKPDGIKTADYLWNNEYWDLKDIKNGQSSRTVDNTIKRTKNQTNNIILDVSNNNLSNNEIIRQVKKIYITNGREWIDKIIVKRENKVIIILKRK